MIPEQDALTPMVAYLEARDALRNGDRESAARELARALGAEEAPPFVVDNLEDLLDHTTPAGRVVLGAMAPLQRREEKDRAGAEDRTARS